MRIALVLAALAVGACASAGQVGRHLEQGLNPFASSRVSLLSVRHQGPYLLAQFRGGSRVLSFYAPAGDEGCARLLRPEVSLTYRKHGHFGRFEEGDAHCDAVGVGSLAAWRDRQPRGDTRGSIVPRATVRFREIARDGEVALVRGRFPLAGRAGIPAGYDLVAILPLRPACERPLARGEGSLEFLAAGPEAFRIVGEDAPCPVLGFAQPLDEAPRED